MSWLVGVRRAHHVPAEHVSRRTIARAGEPFTICRVFRRRTVLAPTRRIGT